jgi:hypothetical protein
MACDRFRKFQIIPAARFWCEEHVLEDEQPGHQPRWQRRLPWLYATYRTKALRQKIPINLRRKPPETRETGRPGEAGSRLSSNSESRRQRNHEPRTA